LYWSKLTDTGAAPMFENRYVDLDEATVVTTGSEDPAPVPAFTTVLSIAAESA
jgi:hypothetical protein